MTDHPLHDLDYMRRALALARASTGLASPNPMVGCILVRDGGILAEGAHRYAAREHAEIVALKSAAAHGIDPAGATAYVTLEPCSHHGRTPPCADALIAARVARVLAATLDPNPQVGGRGLDRIRAAGIPAEAGLCQSEARELNAGFACWIRTRRPLVTLKAALSADGMLAPPARARTPGETFWLTGPLARAQVQHLRHAADAVLTGIGTVLADDPLLTDRSGGLRRRRLLRVVLDSDLRTPLNSRLIRTASAMGGSDVLILCGPRAPESRAAALIAAGAEVLRLPESPIANPEAPGAPSMPADTSSTQTSADQTPPNQTSANQNKGIVLSETKDPPPKNIVILSEAKDLFLPQENSAMSETGRLDLAAVLDLLGSRQVLNLLLECGSQLNGAFLAAGLVDRVVLFHTPARLGPGSVPFATGFGPPALLQPSLTGAHQSQLGPDTCLTGTLHDPWPAP